MEFCSFLLKLFKQILYLVIRINFFQSIINVHRKCHSHNALRLDCGHCARADFGCHNVLTIFELRHVFLHCRYGMLSFLTDGVDGAFFYKNPFIYQILINVEIARPTEVNINGIAVGRSHSNPENRLVMRGRMCHWWQKLDCKLLLKILTFQAHQRRRRGNGCNDGKLQ